MACAATACRQTGCCRDEDDGELVASTKKKAEEPIIKTNSVSTDTASSNTSNSTNASSSEGSGHRQSLCVKCKTDEALIGDESRLCFGCFRSSLFGKFKVTVTTKDLISPLDNVLVAFSGGPSSRVALQFVHELQQKAQRNLDASRDKSLPVFGVGIAFIDESAISSIPSHEFGQAIQDIRSIVSSLAPPAKELFIAPIGNIFSLDSNDGIERLNELLCAINDVTGKEDLLRYLRMISLQKIASEHGYNKLVLGSCASRIACHVISATVKGQGYSLPADIQYVDARWEVPVVLPLRDCLIQELKVLCHRESLKTLELLDGPHSGINGLVSSFVTLLQEENPSREPTIVRTAEKLTPFNFNRLPETNDSSNHLSFRRRHKKLNFIPNESNPSEFFCPICNSPIKNSDLESLRSNLGHSETNADIFWASCCSSCQFQILPKEPSPMEHFYSLLPKPVVARVRDGICSNQDWLREQIKDCLLSDDEEGS
ncbi:cytoplasmic tRNA 2-thiolation protein 2 [Telopea speciosissima]|uniref:cytoplasmic tRNA 2-thiolation protein 2 n=1 Tax=Telopea speciosissima TaxID=54955 RepID=UPI001CC34776|nr:cytoplasmic tRNA 2-thiolation protein 2 [Telopea speciosissima]